MNDPKDGWQETGFPPYLQHDAAKYMNVAGISFIQPADLMNDAYDLPPQVANAVKILRSQGVQVQLLIGGQVSRGWDELQANPQKASSKAIELMKKYDCGMQIDNEAGGDAKNDGGTYHFNTGRGTDRSVCAAQPNPSKSCRAGCSCCRTARDEMQLVSYTWSMKVTVSDE